MTSSRRRDEDWRDFCPVPPTEFIYPDLAGPTDDPNVSFEAICARAKPSFNGFYGDGVVDALAAANVVAQVRR